MRLWVTYLPGVTIALCLGGSLPRTALTASMTIADSDSLCRALVRNIFKNSYVYLYLIAGKCKRQCPPTLNVLIKAIQRHSGTSMLA